MITTYNILSPFLGYSPLVFVGYKFLNGMHCRCVRFQISREASQVDSKDVRLVNCWLNPDIISLEKIPTTMVNDDIVMIYDWPNMVLECGYSFCWSFGFIGFIPTEGAGIMVTNRRKVVFVVWGRPCGERINCYRKSCLLIGLLPFILTFMGCGFGWASEWTAKIWWFQKRLPSTFYLPNEYSKA